MREIRYNKNNISLTVLIIGLLFSVLPSQQTQAVVLKLATISPDGTMWMEKMRTGAAEISQRTEGRVKFKFYPGGVMGNDQSVLRKMRFGQLQGGVFTAGSLSSVYPDLNIYSLPFIFASQDEVDFVRARMDESLLQGLAQRGMIGFGFAGGGFAYNMSTAPQFSLQALRKQKVWTPEGDTVAKAVMDAAGIAPIPLPISDVLTGLQTGMINVVAVSPVGAIAFQWYTKVPYLMDVPISYVYALTIIDKKAFKKVRPDDQAIIREVMTRVNTDIDAQNRVDNQKAIEALKRQGVTFVRPAPELLAEWQVVANKAIQLLGKQGAFTATMLKTLQSNLQQMRSNSAQ